LGWIAELWILAQLAGARCFSVPTRCHAHHVKVVGVNHRRWWAIGRVKIIVVIVIIKSSIPNRRWWTPTRTRPATTPQAQLLFSQRQLALLEHQFALPES
jgi:hypothetical protein